MMEFEEVARKIQILKSLVKINFKKYLNIVDKYKTAKHEHPPFPRGSTFDRP